MTKETVNKLSQLIRDKDLEINSLKDRNDSLVGLIKSQEGEMQSGATATDQLGNRELEALKEQLSQLAREKQQFYEALTQKHQESLAYYSEIERLNQVLVQQQQQQQLHQRQAGPAKDDEDAVPGLRSEKSVIDNSNEIIVLKAKIRDLEERLERYRLSGGPRRRFLSESVQADPAGEEDRREKGQEEEDQLRSGAEMKLLESKLQETGRIAEARDKVYKNYFFQKKHS